ncbi:MAG: flippase-like domain-containing protein [Chitinophagales bacterium]|nr:flippase-like domain-containing protein [Chitinophagales bacterium]
MEIKKGSLIQLVISLTLGIGLVYWFINQMTPEQIDATIDSFKRINYWWLSGIFVFGLIANFARARRWILMLKPTGHNPGLVNTFHAINVMFFANLFVPRLGEVTRCGILAKYEDVPIEKSIGTMIVERLIDAICLFGLLGILLLAEREKVSALLNDSFTPKSDNSQEMSLLLKYGIPVFLILLLLGISIYIIRKFGFEKLKEIFLTRMKGLIDGIISFRKMKNKGEFVFQTVLMWICYILMPYMCFISLPETSTLSMMAALACTIFGGFAMIATPGGIGAYPIAIRAVLLLYGITEVIGGAIGTVIWGAQTVGVFSMGIISLILLSLFHKKRKESGVPTL